MAPIKGFATVRNVPNPVAHEAHGVRTELLRDTSISLQVLSVTIYMLIYPKNKEFFVFAYPGFEPTLPRSARSDAEFMD